VAVAAAWAGSCGAPPPSVPAAVVEADPSAVCEGDGYRTPILLDASDSSPRLTLVPAAGDPDAAPLALEWRLSGAEWVLLEGDLASETLVVAIAGDRPLHVELEVRDAEGGTATALETVRITAGGCDE